jgi:hypothetical protein
VCKVSDLDKVPVAQSAPYAYTDERVGRGDGGVPLNKTAMIPSLLFVSPLEPKIRRTLCKEQWGISTLSIEVLYEPTQGLFLVPCPLKFPCNVITVSGAELITDLAFKRHQARIDIRLPRRLNDPYREQTVPGRAEIRTCCGRRERAPAYKLPGGTAIRPDR